MQFVKTETTETYEIKKSKFIAYLFPYSIFDEKMAQIKKEHPKGRHFVYAYRHLNGYEQIVENCSDDGEPKGTSGKPSLAVMAGNEMINSAVIIVRYFGGIKLGTGGLVRAYSDAVNQVISEATLYPYEKIYEQIISFQYPFLSQVEYNINKLEIRVEEKNFDEDVTFKIAGNKESLDSFNQFLHKENIV